MIDDVGLSRGAEAVVAARLNSRTHWLLLAGLITTTTCVGDTERPRFVVRDSAGVTIVENDTVASLARERRPDSGATMTLGTPVYRIGAVDGPESLYRVRHVLLDPDGGVAVVETSTGTIRFFDGRGAPTREIGGLGEGPGEFRGLYWAARVAGDTILAHDAMFPGGLSVFDPEGGFVRSSGLPRVGPGELAIIGGWRHGEAVLLRQFSDESLQPGDVYSYGVYGVTSAGEVGTDLGLWPMGVRRAGFEAFPSRASFAASGDLFLYTPGDQFEVRVFDKAGNLQRIARVSRPRVVVTQADIEAFRTEQWEPMVARAAGTPLEQRIRQFGDPVIADSMPAYTALLANPAGGFWARRAGHRGDPTVLWDVFGADGAYAGALELPAGFQPMSLTDRHVAGVFRDENDVEFVEVYELMTNQAAP